MIIWLILGALGLYAFTASSDVRADKPKLPRLDFLVDASNPGVEKFADPLFECLGAKMDPNFEAEGYAADNALGSYLLNPNKAGLPRDMGYGYLATVPNNAPARIAALRARVDLLGKEPPSNADKIADGYVVPSSVLEGLVGASFKGLREVRNSLSVTFGSKSAEDIAKAFSVPLADAKVYADRAQGLLAKYTSPQEVSKLVTGIVKDVPPVAVAISIAILNEVVKGLSGTASDLETFLSISAIVSQAAALMGPVGMGVAAGVSLVSSAIAAKVQNHKDLCTATQNSITQASTRAISQGLPVPWHIEEVFSPACNETSFLAASAFRETREQERLRYTLDKSYRYFSGGGKSTLYDDWGETAGSGQFGLGPLARGYVKRWWSLAQLYMSDPKVYRVFSALGIDGYGGVLASDEQVMLVAAPIAVAYGYPVDYFARALWAKSKGWHDAPEDDSSVVFKNIGLRYLYNAGGDAPPADVEVVACKGAVANAWWLQWATLARDAFDLTTSLPKPPPDSAEWGPQEIETIPAMPSLGIEVIRPIGVLSSLRPNF